MIAKMAPTMLSRCLDILVESQATWPLATNWRIGLESFACGQKGSTSKDGTMADGVSSLAAAPYRVPVCTR